MAPQQTFWDKFQDQLQSLVKKFVKKFHVLEGGHNDNYLGMPFLKKNSAILTFDGSNQNSLSLIIGVPVLAT